MTAPKYTAAAIAAIRDAVDAERDFAGWLAAVLATVAADLGSTYAVVASRPGSWEAGHVVDLLAGTVGENDEYLDRFRR